MTQVACLPKLEKIGRTAGALKTVNILSKFPVLLVNYKYIIARCLNYYSMSFLQRLKEDFLPVKSSFELNMKKCSPLKARFENVAQGTKAPVVNT